MGDFLTPKEPRELPHHLCESVTDSVTARDTALWCGKDVAGDGTSNRSAGINVLSGFYAYQE